MNDQYVYALVRTDIPIEDQVVQVAHACLEAGHAFYRPSIGCHIDPDGQLRHEREVASLILLQVANHRELIRVAEQLTSEDIHYELFFEPDEGMGWTSLATEPITGAKRNVFRNFKLWRKP